MFFVGGMPGNHELFRNELEKEFFEMSHANESVNILNVFMYSAVCPDNAFGAGSTRTCASMQHCYINVVKLEILSQIFNNSGYHCMVSGVLMHKGCGH